MAVAGLVLGICSLVFAWFGWFAFAGVACGIAGIILSVKGKKAEPEKAGMCTAGLVLSIIGLVLSGIMAIACALCSAITSSATSELEDLAKQLESLQ